jgi:predicted O-linked N-acetylglucosamine transferase (SPINDLY family)
MAAWLDKLMKGPAAVTGREAARADPERHYQLGMSLQMQGKRDAAKAEYGAALALAPEHADAHNNLGVLLKEEGRFEQALQHHRQALAARPDFVDALNNIAVALQGLGKAAEALPYFDRALALQPGHAGLHYNQGAALQALGELDAALSHYREALRLYPELAPAHSNLGYVLSTQGKFAEAEPHVVRALELQPEADELRLNLGSVQLSLGKFAQAQQEFERVLARSPGNAQAELHLGWALKEQGDFPAAERHYRRALELRPDFAEAQDKLGSLHKDRGQIEPALASLRKALALEPDFVAAHSNLCLSLNYAVGATPQEIHAEHLEFARRHCAGFAPLAHANRADPERRLRIGYVSGDFRAHVVAHFIEPVLAYHDHSCCEVYCYYNFHTHDAITARLRAYADHWRDIFGLGDDAVARKVQADGIDILVDLSGHTGLNRLLVFARRPAPVQASYLGYLNTTGLDAMDYRISDARAAPAGMLDACHSEKLERLPDTQWCYQAPSQAPEVSALPGLKNAYLSFGAFQTLAKINRPVIELWSRVLQRLPQARLLVVASGLKSIAGEFEREFARHGIAPGRVELMGAVAFAEYLALHDRVDVMLDTFPYAGGTTTCHALWMGVPVISLPGPTATSRGGASLLAAVGLEEFIAQDAEHYIAIASRLAADMPQLACVRAGLRQRMLASPLCDARRFTRKLEAAYRSMWRIWCAKQ